MNQEIKIGTTNQEIIIKNRKELEIKGINKIESLNEYEFVIDTNLGILIVKGDELEMKHLDIEKGNLWIVGHIDSLIYKDSTTKKEKKQGFLTKLFK
ncbi:MAG: sporulation protein YabP [Bacilli bacterium]